MQNSDPFDKIRAIKSAQEALETRGEGEKAFFEKVPVIGRFFKSDSSLQIDNAAENLNKHFGYRVIDKNNNNASNRAALRNLLNINVNGIAESISAKAKQSGDSYSEYKAFELQQKLLSLPVNSYDREDLYNIIDAMNDLGDEVSKGLPLGSAMTQSKFSKRIDNLTNNFITKSMAKSYDVYENSLESFLKGGIVGAGESVAGIADSIINLASLGGLTSAEHRTVVLDAVKKVLPDLTEEEERGILGKAGKEAGSLATAVAWFGVPSTALDAAKFVAIPKAIEFLVDSLGIPENIVNAGLGIVNAGVASRHLKGIYKGMKQKFSYPEVEGNIKTEVPTLKDGEFQNKAIQEIQENLESMPPEDQIKYANEIDSYDANIEEMIVNNDQLPTAQNPADISSPATQTVINNSIESGRNTPREYLEISDTTQQFELDRKALLNSDNVEYKNTANQIRYDAQSQMNDSIQRALIGEDFRSIGQGKEAYGTSVRDLFVAMDAAFTETQNRLYNDAANSITNGIPEGVSPEDFKRVNKKCADIITKLDKSLTSEYVKVKDGDYPSRRAEVRFINSLIPDAKSNYIESMESQIRQGNLKNVVTKLDDMVKTLNQKAIDVEGDSKSIKRAKLFEVVKEVAKTRDSMYDATSEIFPNSKKAIKEANTYFREKTGGLRRLISSGIGEGSDIVAILKATPERLSSAFNPSKESIMRNINKFICQEVASIDILNNQFQSFNKHSWATVLGNKKITPDATGIEGVNTLRTEARNPNSPLSILMKLDSTKAAMVNEFIGFGSNFAANNAVKSNPSQSGVRLENTIKSVAKKIPLVGTAMEVSNEAKLAEINESMVNYLNSANSNNTKAIIGMTKNSKSNMRKYLEYFGLDKARYSSRDDRDEPGI